MLLSCDSDILNKFKNYTKSYIQNKYKTKFRNNQPLSFKFSCHSLEVLIQFLISPDSSVGRAVD
jgi:hypothetical protein